MEKYIKSKDITQWQKDLLNNVSYYSACRFLGVGKYEKIIEKTEGDLIKKLEERTGTNQRFMLYAVCPFCSYNYSIHIGNYFC